LLLLGLEAGLHLQSSVSQHLFLFLQVLDLKFLLEQFSFFQVKIFGCLVLISVQCLNLDSEFFFLLPELLGDVNNRFFFLSELGHFNINLLAVILLAFDVAVEFADLVFVLVYHIFVLLVQLLDLLQLVSLLRCQLLFVFHFQVIGYLFAILVQPLHLLQPLLEVIEQLFDIGLMPIVQLLDFCFKAPFHLILILLKLAELVLFVLELLVV